ncbi:unnamed protein product [Auanema sp. JU1783]|nr:unnamed protein product [Auanema sp. JU1783]
MFRKLTGSQDYSPLSWQDFFDEKQSISINGDSFNVYTKGKTGPIYLFLHGGGYSGVTFGPLIKNMSKLIDCRIFAPDLRGHGETICADSNQLSRDTLVQDIANVFNSYYKAQNDVEENPPVCVVGHSMGGAMAVRVVQSELVPNSIALVVLDVVEGTALDALVSMNTVLNNRPEYFSSEEEAIRWCLAHSVTSNKTSARLSMPHQLKKTENNRFTWRIDLRKSEPYWREWFTGLSEAFLNNKASKLLVLAGVDRLDKTLMIGQMQGKFQTVMMPKSGHAIHEDSPFELADALAAFSVRYRFATYHDSTKTKSKA